MESFTAQMNAVKPESEIDIASAIQAHASPSTGTLLMVGAIVVIIHARCDACKQPLRWVPEDYTEIGTLEMLSLEEINKRTIPEGFLFGDDNTAWHIGCRQ